MKLIRGKLTYANVVSTLCLFLLVAGGTAFAASQLGKNSVGTKQLKKNSVTAVKIKDGAVTSAKLDSSSKTALTGPQGLRGEPGAAGANGSAVGFAYVEASAAGITVNPALAHNLTAANITQSVAGVYCFHDLPFTPKSVMAMADAHGYYDSLARGTLTSTFACEFPPNQAVVQIQRPVEHPGSCCYDDNFFVWFE